MLHPHSPPELWPKASAAPQTSTPSCLTVPITANEAAAAPLMSKPFGVAIATDKPAVHAVETSLPLRLALEAAPLASQPFRRRIDDASHT